MCLERERHSVQRGKLARIDRDERFVREILWLHFSALGSFGNVQMEVTDLAEIVLAGWLTLRDEGKNQLVGFGRVCDGLFPGSQRASFCVSTLCILVLECFLQG